MPQKRELIIAAILIFGMLGAQTWRVVSFNRDLKLYEQEQILLDEIRRGDSSRVVHAYHFVADGEMLWQLRSLEWTALTHLRQVDSLRLVSPSYPLTARSLDSLRLVQKKSSQEFSRLEQMIRHDVRDWAKNTHDKRRTLLIIVTAKSAGSRTGGFFYPSMHLYGFTPTEARAVPAAPPTPKAPSPTDDKSVDFFIKKSRG